MKNTTTSLLIASLLLQFYAKKFRIHALRTWLFTFNCFAVVNMMWWMFLLNPLRGSVGDGRACIHALGTWLLTFNCFAVVKSKR